VAIRAVNWLAGYSLLEQALQGDTEQSFKKRLTASLWEHASFIRTHLEWNGPFASRRANHFLADLTGLFTLGVFFADTTRGRRWLRFAQHNLEVEIRRQVLEDGFHFECSTSYQRLCLEMLLWCWSLGSRAGVPFSDTFRDRLGRMQSCVRACTRPDGLVPVCGDNDDGRLLFCGLNAINDHRYLWPQPPPEAYNADVALLQGDETPQFDTASDLKEFPLAGYYILRSHEYYLLIRAGALAHNGTHAHCDQLGFELALPGGPVFVDRGSYVYTSDIEQRNRYRSSRAHNVLTLNGAEQNRQTGVVFGLADDTRTQVLETGADSLKARHTGFKSLEREHVSHTRTFQLSSSGRTLAISDEVEGILQGDRLEWYFQLAPGIAVEIGDGRAVLNRDGQPVCRLEFPAEMQLHSERFDHSPTYGVLQEAITLTLTHAIEHAVSQYVTRFLITWEKR
ncbi:alginate lyase family protein, partial [bacterium]|nr:alginate lyase family protein [bacterium]